MAASIYIAVDEKMIAAPLWEQHTYENKEAHFHTVVTANSTRQELFFTFNVHS